MLMDCLFFVLVNAAVTESSATNPRPLKRCRTCRNPMRGHKYVLDCPKNMPT